MSKRSRPLVSAKHRAAAKWGPKTWSNVPDPNPDLEGAMRRNIEKIDRAIRGEPEPREIQPGDVVPKDPK